MTDGAPTILQPATVERPARQSTWLNLARPAWLPDTISLWRRSLAARLIAGSTLSISLVLGILGLAIYFSVQKSLYNEFDRGLLTEARALAAMAEQENSSVSFDFDPTQLPEFLARNHPDYFQAWFADGRVLARSASLANRDLAVTLPAANAINGVFSECTLPDGHHGRAIGLSCTARPSVEDRGLATPISLRLVVARGTGPLHHTLEELHWLLLSLVGVAVVVCGFVLLLVVSRAMAPVRRVGREIESLSGSQLSRRLSSAGVPTELAPVVEKLNGLLGRIDESFARERGFAADVAHELRTPLAGLAATLEVCRLRPRDSAGYESAIDKSRGMVDRMQSMVQTLLMLTRAEAGQLKVDTTQVDAVALIEETLAELNPRSAAASLKIRWIPSEPRHLHTDSEKLRIILRNLLDNAVTYTNPAGEVHISIATLTGRWSLRVANTGSRLALADVAKVFDRFWRGDESRTDTGIHCGLGLSLCRRLTHLLGGTLEVQTTPGGWFIVTLELPAPEINISTSPR